MGNLTVDAVFGRINQNNDAVLDRNDIKRFAEKAGVGDGWLGSTKVRMVVDKFMDSFDDNRNGRVDGAEFRKNARKFTELAGLDMKLFDQADKRPRDGRLTYGELKPALQDRLEREGASYPSETADAGAKLAIAAAGQGGAIARGDLESLLADIQGPSIMDRMRGFLRRLFN